MIFSTQKLPSSYVLRDVLFQYLYRPHYYLFKWSFRSIYWNFVSTLKILFITLSIEPPPVNTIPFSFEFYRPYH